MAYLPGATPISLIEDAGENRGTLYLGNWKGAKDIENLKNSGVGYVLSVTPAKSTYAKKYKKEAIEHKIIEAQDAEDYDLFAHMDDAADYIHESLAKSNVFVHCLGGVSRSSSCVMAYYIKYRGMSFDDVHKMVVEKRVIVKPNPGFVEQLKKFEELHRKAL